MLNLKIARWCTPLRGESFASERPRSVYAYANRARVFMRCPFMLPFLPPGHFLFIHAAFRFAPSKNRLRNASLSNRDRTADVSLGFLHSNWITQAAAHRQQGCTPWLLEGHSKNSIKKKNGSDLIRDTPPNVHAGKWTEEHAWIQRCGQSPVHSVKAQQWRMHIEYICARPKTISLEHRMACCWGKKGKLDGFTSLCSKEKAFCPSSNV